MSIAPGWPPSLPRPIEIAGGTDARIEHAYTYDRRTARKLVRRWGGRFFPLGPDPRRTLYEWTWDGTRTDWGKFDGRLSG